MWLIYNDFIFSEDQQFYVLWSNYPHSIWHVVDYEK